MEELRAVIAPNPTELTCHPGTASRAVRRIEVRAGWRPDRALKFRYTLTGDIKRLRIAASRAPHRSEGLWRHTCFEAFIAAEGRPGYYEFNFAPSGEWAVYFFRGYRDRALLDQEGLDPTIVVRRDPDAFELSAIVQIDRLSRLRSATRLQLGLSAVIEENKKTLTYWALAHPPGQPDFHHAKGFALEMARTRANAAGKRTVKK